MYNVYKKQYLYAFPMKTEKVKIKFLLANWPTDELAKSYNAARDA